MLLLVASIWENLQRDFAQGRELHPLLCRNSLDKQRIPRLLKVCSSVAFSFSFVVLGRVSLPPDSTSTIRCLRLRGRLQLARLPLCRAMQRLPLSAESKTPHDCGRSGGGSTCLRMPLAVCLQPQRLLRQYGCFSQIADSLGGAFSLGCWSHA